jgi:Rrf2 family iron-sulfur cluster assembly transcriptional regulator
MKITSKSRSAVVAMVYLAARDQKDQQAVPLKQIAQENNLSLHFLEQIFSKLRKSELVVSVRGSSGGYALAKEPQNIVIFDVINAIETIDVSTRCANKSGCISQTKRCLTHSLWENLDLKSHIFLKKTTLQDVITNNYGKNC